MDPNATLAEIRGLIGKGRAHRLSGEESDRLVELTDALNEWISRGGFLPDAWAAGARRERDRLTRLV